MALSNKYGALLLTTGNKSELSVGYCTLYGDMNGGLAVISDVPKTMVYALARWRKRPAGRRFPRPRREDAVRRVAAGSDRPGQPASQRRAFDDILQRHVEQHLPAEASSCGGFDLIGRARVAPRAPGRDWAQSRQCRA